MTVLKWQECSSVVFRYTMMKLCVAPLARDFVVKTSREWQTKFSPGRVIGWESTKTGRKIKTQPPSPAMFPRPPLQCQSATFLPHCPPQCPPPSSPCQLGHLDRYHFHFPPSNFMSVDHLHISGTKSGETRNCANNLCGYWNCACAFLALTFFCLVLCWFFCRVSVWLGS